MDVAIKSIKIAELGSKGDAARAAAMELRAEAVLTGSLKHVNVIRVLGVLHPEALNIALVVECVVLLLVNACCMFEATAPWKLQAVAFE